MKKPVTIYSGGSFGITKIEAVLTDFGTTNYAQYKNVPFIHFIRKGKRKEEVITKTYHPYLLVIEGHGHIDPADSFNAPINVGEDMVIKKSTYSCFDERYKTDFDALICEYIKDKNIVLDVRHTIDTNLITEKNAA